MRSGRAARDAIRTQRSGKTAAALRERLGEFGFLVDRLGFGEGAESLVLAAQVVSEVGFGPVGTFGAKARRAPRDRGPGIEVVVDRLLAGVVGEDRRNRAGRGFGPVRKRRDF